MMYDMMANKQRSRRTPRRLPRSCWQGMAAMQRLTGSRNSRTAPVPLQQYRNKEDMIAKVAEIDLHST